MQTEKIAVIVFAIILIGALSAYLIINENALDNLFSNSEKIIEEGDCADVNYIGRFQVNNTVFDTSYEDIAKQEGIYDETRTYTFLKIFVDPNSTMSSPEGYTDYTQGMLPGFIKGLIGMKEGETKTVTIPPEEAYGNWSEKIIGSNEKLSQSLFIPIPYDYTQNITAFQEAFPDINISMGESFDFGNSSWTFDEKGVCTANITNVTEYNVTYRLDPVNGSEFIMPEYNCNSMILTTNDSTNFSVKLLFEKGHKFTLIHPYYGFPYHLLVIDVNETNATFAINMNAPELQFVNQTLVFEITVDDIYKTSQE